MAPKWIPLCRSMQLYCEPYFAAITNWSSYEMYAIIHNRLRLVETACLIFHAHSNNPVVYKFDIVFHHPHVPLLPEVPPTAGRKYKVGGDKIAYETAMRKQPNDLFHKAGVFFQANLLKAIAGWTAEILAGANIETRATIIAAVEKLFRIPEEAGEARFVYTLENSNKIMEYPTVDLCTAGLQFFRFILETRQPGSTLNAAAIKRPTPQPTDGRMKNNHKRARSEEEDEWEADPQGVMWTNKHASIGTEVAAYIPQPSQLSCSSSAALANDPRGKLLRGKVIKFAPPSAPGLTDQLYHIRWEDSDEQDFDELDMEQAMDLFDSLEGWTRHHSTVGLRVAAYFPVPGSSAQALFCGTVTKVTVSTAGEKKLFRVLFDDGYVHDYLEPELNEGVKLYAAEGESVHLRAPCIRREPTTKPATNTNPVVVRPVVKTVEERVGTRNVPARPSTGGFVIPKNLRCSSGSSCSSGSDSSFNSGTGSRSDSRSDSGFGSDSSCSASSSNSSSDEEENEDEQPRKRKKSNNIDSKRTLSEEEEEWETDDFCVTWTTVHKSVGTQVAAFFSQRDSATSSQASAESVPFHGRPNLQTLIHGRVVKYAPPRANENAQPQYLIQWEDGDDEYYNHREFAKAVDLFDSLKGWKKRHKVHGRRDD